MNSEKIVISNIDIKKEKISNNNNLYKYLFFFILFSFIINHLILYINIKYWKIENLNQNKSFLEILNKNFNNIFNNNNISNKLKLLKLITNNNKLQYKGIENCLINNPDSDYCIYHLISPKKVIGRKRILIGEKADGCYVLLDDFKNIKYAYSFGISNMIQFDKNLAERGIDVYMYDHTIEALPYNNTKFHWKKIGIGGKNEKNKLLKTLEELILENGHSFEKNMILKIDVEHWEWKALEDISDRILNQFKYIVIEYHFRIQQNYKLYYKVLKKLHETHQAFYLRCNGRYRIVTFGNNMICTSLEVSYIIKKNYTFTKDETIYPIFEFDFQPPILDGRTEFNLNILKLFDS